MKLLHGTSMKRLQKIKRDGLRSPYLTDLEAVAEFFADEAAYLDRDVPIILEITVRDPGKLRADLRMYDQPISAVLDALEVSSESMYHQMRRDGDMFLDPPARDWETSLQEMHSVRHRGPVAPRDVGVYTIAERE